MVMLKLLRAYVDDDVGGGGGGGSDNDNDDDFDDIHVVNVTFMVMLIC